MAELTLIIIDLAAGHAKLIGTEPRALPNHFSNWRRLSWLVILRALCLCMRAGALDHQGQAFCHRSGGRLAAY
jgi:hypothetical protein